LPAGYRLAFSSDADILPTITEAVEAERQCCRFLRLAVTVEPDGGPIALELPGPPARGTLWRRCSTCDRADQR